MDWGVEDAREFLNLESKNEGAAGLDSQVRLLNGVFKDDCCGTGDLCNELDIVEARPILRGGVGGERG